MEFGQSQEMNIRIVPCKGQYVQVQDLLFQVDKELKDQQEVDLKNLLVFSGEQKAEHNYVIGIKQITEIGLKAMSPGINDPGTAVMTLDYLTELLALRMKLSDVETYSRDNVSYTLELRTVDFDELLYELLASYRQYCKHDYILMRKIIHMLDYLLERSESETRKKALERQLVVLKEDIMDSIINSSDRQKLMALMD